MGCIVTAKTRLMIASLLKAALCIVKKRAEDVSNKQQFVISSIHHYQTVVHSNHMDSNTNYYTLLF
jgi:hypothetical protein